MVLISVIVPVYNVEAYLERCIRSVFAQTYSDWELILVDDGSPDRSPEICDRYARQDSRIQVIHKQNGGLSSARNAGLDIKRGNYVTFLDSDDFWHPEYLQTLLTLCEKKQADIAQCGFIRGRANSFPANISVPHVRAYNNHSIFLERGAKIIMWGKLYKSKLFDDIRMPVGKINEDDFTSWKLYYRASGIVVTDQLLYYYTCNPQSIMAQQKQVPRLDFLEAYTERIAYFEEQGVGDLEKQSRGHFCLALLLSLRNRNLTLCQSERLHRAFGENYGRIGHSRYVPVVHRMLFHVFRVAPDTVIKILRFIKR